MMMRCEVMPQERTESLSAVPGRRQFFLGQGRASTPLRRRLPALLHLSAGSEAEHHRNLSHLQPGRDLCLKRLDLDYAGTAR